MKVLLVSEGKHELGNEYRDEKFAALATLVSRTALMELQCTPMSVRDAAFRVNGKPDQGFGGRLFKRAVRCLIYAASHGFDALVFVIDQDDDPDRRHPLDAAQEYQGVVLVRAFGLAVQSFDAWMIADEQALTKVLERPILRQPDPEKIRDPKTHCRGLRGDSDISLTDLYELVARNTTVETIEQRCPKGFAVFAARVRRL